MLQKEIWNSCLLFIKYILFFNTPKREATSLRGVPFSNSLSALYFVLHDLFSARRFVATDAIIVEFQSVDKQYIRQTKCNAVESFDWHLNHAGHSTGIDYGQLALESCKAPNTCHNVRVIERKYSMGQKHLLELKRCSSYGGSSNTELLMRIYWEIFTLPEESFELTRSSNNRNSSYSLLYHFLSDDKKTMAF